ncbi:adenylate kinase, partial [Kibdelosporangium lantanae]
WRGWLSADHPVWWAWSQFERKRAQVLEYSAEHPHVKVIRVRTARQVRALLSRSSPPAPR